MHHALKYGAPNSENLRFFQNFVVSYDSRLRNPRWVIEHITRDRARGEANRCHSARWRSSSLHPCCRSTVLLANASSQEECGVL